MSRKLTSSSIFSVRSNGTTQRGARPPPQNNSANFSKNLAKSDLNPQYVFTDLEKGAVSAVAVTFTQALTPGCFFHYSQSLWQYPQKAV